MRSAINPVDIRPPFGHYSHGLAVAPPGRMLFCSGQLGVRPDDTVPADVEAQAEVCFASIGAILKADGLDFGHVVRLCGYVTSRDHMAAYMRVRDRYVGEPLPASTLVIVAGFTRPEFLVEVEATAVGD